MTMTSDEQQKIAAAATILRRLETAGLAAEQDNVTADEWDQIVDCAEVMVLRLKKYGVAIEQDDDEGVILRDLERKGITKRGEP
jgi:hypothetical protein